MTSNEARGKNETAKTGKSEDVVKGGGGEERREDIIKGSDRGREDGDFNLIRVSFKVKNPIVLIWSEHAECARQVKCETWSSTSSEY